MDGRSEGYHEIDAVFMIGEPTKCPFGHPIKPKYTKCFEREIDLSGN